MNAQESIAAFLRGETDILTFRQAYDAQPEIGDFLQRVLDGMRRTNAPTRYHWETRRDGVQVHSRSVVDDLYLQYDPAMPYDPRYSEAYGFVLDVVPEYLESGLSEVYIREQVFPQFPKR